MREFCFLILIILQLNKTDVFPVTVNLIASEIQISSRELGDVRNCFKSRSGRYSYTKYRL